MYKLPFITKDILIQALQIIEAEDTYLPEFMRLANETEGAVKVRKLVGWVISLGGWVEYRKYIHNPIFKDWGKSTKAEVLEDAIDGGQLRLYKGKGGQWLGIPGEIPERVYC